MPSRTHQPIKIAHNHPPDLSKIQQVIVTWAVSPSRTPYSVRSLSKATPETALALAIDAVLKARPIAHDRSQSAANAQIRAGYYDIRKLAGSSPEERAAALKHGGYNIYRERASANLGYLAQVVDGVYDGDLNNLLKEANQSQERVRHLMKQIKWVGDVGIDIFLTNNVQTIWPSTAPGLDARSLQVSKQLVKLES